MQSRAKRKRAPLLLMLGCMAAGFTALNVAETPKWMSVAVAQETPPPAEPPAEGDGDPNTGTEDCQFVSEEIVDRVPATAPSNWRCEGGDFKFDSQQGTYKKRTNYESPCEPEDVNHTSDWSITEVREDESTGNIILTLEEQGTGGETFNTTEYTPGFCCAGE